MTEAEIADAINEYMAHLHRFSLLIARLSYQVRQKPIIGGVFGHGAFMLASRSSVDGGLDRVDYFVIHAESRFVLGWGDSRQEAMQRARGLLTGAVSASRLAQECSKFSDARLAADEERKRKQAEANAARRAEFETKPKLASIPKRRQRIFEESGGKCHYCETVLTLDGKWHIEHKMPKALGGGNDPGNLVASCVPCNMKKRDQTDIEFKAKRAGML